MTKKSKGKRHITLREAQKRFDALIKRINKEKISYKQLIRLKKDISSFIEKCHEYMEAISQREIKPRGDLNNIRGSINQLVRSLTYRSKSLPEVLSMKNNALIQLPTKSKSKYFGKLRERDYFQDKAKNDDLDANLRSFEQEKLNFRLRMREYPLSEFISDDAND